MVHRCVVQVRKKFEQPSEATQFALLTGETPATLKEGKIVQVRARLAPFSVLPPVAGMNTPHRDYETALRC
jgi:hypothetical protein